MSNFHNIAEDKKKIIESGLKPKLVVLDLDFTVWPFDCNKYIQPPFTFNGTNTIDKYGKLANPYFDVPYILKILIELGIPVAIASRNPSSDFCKSLLQTIRIPDTTLSLWDAIPSENLFHAYSSGSYGCGYGKTKHFTNIQNSCNIAFSDMLFFDDNIENILVAQRSGVTSVHLSQSTGLTWGAFEAGLIVWRRNLSTVKPLEIQDTTMVTQSKKENIDETSKSEGGSVLVGG
jgi:magnesium-dependent phosphatase 1